MSHAEVLDMSAEELAHWQVYFQTYPFDDFKDYANFGNLLALLYNINRGDKPARDAFDFLPKFLTPDGKPMKQETLKNRVNLLKKIFKDKKP
jgi:microcystin degradation protein MlrC